MRIYSFDEILKGALSRRDVILTIGVFDGFHLGHQSLIRKMMEKKSGHPGAETVLITFSVNPKTKFPRNVDTLRLREENAEKWGVDSFVIIDFSSDFSKTSACGFVEMLSSSFNPVAVVVGEDFRFGSSSSSASAYDLDSLFSSCGRKVDVTIMQSILTKGGEKISSTLVRRVIENGDVECISALTGRSYRVDLMPIPHRFDSGTLVLPPSSIQQLLPPPGVYGASLEFGNGHRIDVSALLSTSEVRIAAENGSIERMVGEEEGMDSIYFLEKKNGIK